MTEDEARAALNDDPRALIDRIGRELDACIVLLGLMILANVVILALDCAR